jgi:hypothetical protein
MTEKETKKTISLGVAGEIWEEIKDLPIDMYALADQTVKNHVEMKKVPGEVLFLKPKSQAVIASLGTAIGAKYAVNTTDGGFLTVERIEAIPVVDDDYVYYQRRGKVEKILRKKLL